MIERIAWTLIHFVWQGTAIAAMLAVTLKLTQRSSSSLRYVLACFALTLVAGAPIVTYLVLAPSDDLSLARTIASGDLKWSPGEAVLSVTMADRRLIAIVLIWLAGVIGLSLRLVVSLAQLARWRRRYTRPAPEEWQERLVALGKRLHLNRGVELLVSDRLAVPSAWGVVRPLIVIPASLLSGLPADQVETVLLHELAHVRRHDYLVNLLQSVVETALFYHPAVWWISSIVRLERERCCDDVVVRLTVDPMPYARALLYLEERRQTLPRLALSAKGTPLMNRIARILGNPPTPSRISPLASTFAVLAVLGATLGGVYKAQAQSTSPAKPTAEKPLPARRVTTPAMSKPSAAALKKAKLELEKHQRMLLTLQSKVNAQRSVDELSKTRAELAALKAQLFALQAETQAMQKQKLALLDMSKDKGRAAADKKLAESRSLSAPAAMEADSDEIEHSVGMNSDNTHYFIDVKNGGFPAVMRRLAQVANIEIVIAPGSYNHVTMYLSMHTPEDLVQILCRAGNATYRMEGNVYFFTPKSADASAGLKAGTFK